MKEALKSRGIPLTPQRLLILEVMENMHGHMSAEEIFEEAKKNYAYMNISTVYRTLDLLKSLDLVTVTDMGGGCLRYHTAKEAGHHHLVCHTCGQTHELPDEALEPVRKYVQEEYGFEAQISHFAIWGLCSECMAKDRSS